MADIVSKAVRSRMMSNIRGKHTKPELAVRSHLHRAGFRFALHRSDLPGRPDIVLPKYRAVVFVHGCFWHRHAGCRFAYTPKTNTEFWMEKISGNVARDLKTEAALMELGWRVLTIWECEITPERLGALSEGIMPAELRRETHLKTRNLIVP